ncbi:MAG: aminopeptidase P family protein [Candidatus Glassbacteria bacterium]|nr:aminopeptidase P family protein [Candidatus Glassbacteria bacterium]
MRDAIGELMDRRDVELLWVTGASHECSEVYYLTGGVSLTAAWILVRPGQQSLLVHGPMEREAAAASGLATLDFSALGREEIARSENDPMAVRLELFIRLAEREGLSGRMAVHGLSDPGEAHQLLRLIEQRLPQIHVVRDIPPVLETARATKDDCELEKMRSVASDALVCLGETFDIIRACRDREGIVVDADGEPLTAGRIKACLRSSMAARNLLETHETILGQGREAGIPHASSDSALPLKTGTATVLDVFPCRGGGGYFFDITRSFTIGRPDPEFEKLYAQVDEVQQAAVEKAGAGVHGSQLQALACDMFENNGHPTIRSHPDTTSGYAHSLGHGIGLEVHEAPFLRLQDNPDERNSLEEGSVFTIEPGLYYPGRGQGVRIEDVVYITGDGSAEILAPFDKFSVLELEG